MNSSYGPAIVISVALHALLIAVMTFGWEAKSHREGAASARFIVVEGV